MSAELGNPLLDARRRLGPHGRDEVLARYGFAVPTDEALDTVAQVSPAGVVELGAGTGHWARLLHDRGVDVLAFDLAPPPSAANRWFAGTAPWFPVAAAPEHVVAEHAERTLLLVWPTRDEPWAAAAARLFHAAGGARLVYVGEPPGGHTGDDELHALLDGFAFCHTCAYGVAGAACVCDITPLWRRRHTVTLPHWEPYDDDLHVYERLDRAAPLAPRPSRTRVRRLAP